MIKRMKAHIKRVWSERDRDTGKIWRNLGIALVIIVGVTIVLAGVGLFLPALGLMCAAWFVHQVLSDVPALSYYQSVVGVIGFWVVGWAIGMLLRVFIFALTGGGK